MENPRIDRLGEQNLSEAKNIMDAWENKGLSFQVVMDFNARCEEIWEFNPRNANYELKKGLTEPSVEDSTIIVTDEYRTRSEMLAYLEKNINNASVIFRNLEL
jgi:hypothetical protein